ncbi:VCBS repeat-containing protein [Yinghuangia soli]|uniref:VCBS repeat-containing protein n=1 Tax=Yinghuangia soli TaxID=2908204 RepID=A0AA41Q0D4_9ACTN|nr:VCBS repeat-containing protein [Yinghuangia soli]MCF2528650.1 VCBS repeat-containing protein [Yinghuangia soli]
MSADLPPAVKARGRAFSLWFRRGAAVAAALAVGTAALPAEAAVPAAAPGGALTFAGAADWDGDGRTDLIARRDATGDLLLFPGDGKSTPGAASGTVIGTGWNGYTFAGVADWAAAGHPGIIARNDGTGDLWLYPGEGTRAPSSLPPVLIGSGWNGYTFAGVADGTGDRLPDITAREDSGARTLWLYPGEGKPAPSSKPRLSLGTGYGDTTLAGVADWGRFGHASPIVRDDLSGDLRYDPGRGGPSVIGTGWGGYTFADTADWDGDGNADLIARADDTTELWVYPGEGKPAPSTKPRISLGTGW